MDQNTHFNLIVLQPALPNYRLDFFNRLHAVYGQGLQVHFSGRDLGVLTAQRPDLPWSVPLGRTIRLPLGLDWQENATRIRPAKGDVVVVSGAPKGLGNLCLMLRARVAGAHVVWWGHHHSPYTTPMRRRLREFVMKFSDQLVFYTDREAEDYRNAATGGQAMPAIGLNNGLNIDGIDPCRVPYRAERRGLDIAFMGRLTAKSQVGLLLAALARCPDGFGRLHVIGDGDNLRALQQVATDLGIGPKVQWHGGMTDEGRIAAIVNRCRLFVYPGDIGLSLIHAMAYGLPIVIHDDMSRHMPEIAAFSQGRTGAVFARGSASDLGRVTCEMLDDTELLDRMSHACLAVVAHTFRTSDMARRFVSMVDELRARKG